MCPPPPDEVAHFRIVRDKEGEAVELPGGGEGERVVLALDLERWGLVRLRWREFASGPWRELAEFEEEISLRAAWELPGMPTLHGWGSVEEALWLAESFRDGEPLPAYLKRVGAVPTSLAARWIGDVLVAWGERGESLAFPTGTTFEVVRERLGRVALLPLAPFSGRELATAGGGVSLAVTLAREFCRLCSGEAQCRFDPGEIPAIPDLFPPAVREALVAVLSGDQDEGPTLFRRALAEISAGAIDEAPLPRGAAREWIRRELAAEGEHTLPELAEPGESAYAISTRLRGTVAQLQALPGAKLLPREGWLDQHHEATRRPGRGRIGQLQVNYLEDLPSVTLVGEERVEGIDLALLLEQTGPLAASDAAVLARRLDALLEHLESRPGAGPIWWLPPEGLLLVTGSRSAVSCAGLVARKGSVFWEETPLKLRLHQTFDSLCEGVGLPGELRKLARTPDLASVAARRSALALPFLSRILTKEKFRWEGTPSGPFEKIHNRLLVDPAGVEENLFLRFPELWQSGSVPSCPGEGDRGEEEKGPDSEGTEEAAVGTREISPIRGEEEGEEAEPPKGADRIRDEEGPGAARVFENRDRPEEVHRPDDAAQDEETEEPLPRRSAPWGWIAVAAVLLAAVVGYGFFTWSHELGPFRPAPKLEFVLPEYQSPKPERSEAREALEELLLAEGSPQSLGLLPLADELDAEMQRVRIEPWLRHLSAKGETSAARVMGLILLASGGPMETTAGWFLEGARGGDVDSRYHYATLRWDAGAKTFTDEQGRTFLEAAAATGHPAAEQFLGHVLLAAGEPGKAFASMERAATHGRVAAIHQLGILRATGTGCTLDRELAYDTFRKAAELGDERAMYDSGRCLAEGFGTRRSFPEALRWMRLAAAAGHEPAKRWLAERGINGT